MSKTIQANYRNVVFLNGRKGGKTLIRDTLILGTTLWSYIPDRHVNEVANNNDTLIGTMNALADALKQYTTAIPTQSGTSGSQTTTNAPVNVVVNAQGSNDIAKAVGDAVQNAIPTIIDKVKVALGQKVPPKSSGADMNKK